MRGRVVDSFDCVLSAAFFSLDHLLQRGSPGKEKERKLRMLSDQKRRVENLNALLDIHMESFERYRIEKMKVQLDANGSG